MDFFLFSFLDDNVYTHGLSSHPRGVIPSPPTPSLTKTANTTCFSLGGTYMKVNEWTFFLDDNVYTHGLSSYPRGVIPPPPPTPNPTPSFIHPIFLFLPVHDRVTSCYPLPPAHFSSSTSPPTTPPPTPTTTTTTTSPPPCQGANFA